MEQELRKRYTDAGQSHVFQFWEELDAAQRDALLASLREINVERANKIFKLTTQKPLKSTTQVDSIKPLPAHALDSVISASPDKILHWKKAGLDAIASNKVAVILLAGGQGTRLGSSDPKGMYDIGLPSHKSLFQLQAERIISLERVASIHSTSKERVSIPWYIMTSGPTRAPTEDFFKKNNYFGINPANIMFFNQGVLPAFTNDGKFYLENKYTPFTAPDGNGGIYAAIRDSGVITDLERRGIPYVHAYCVDNCLVKVADPTFIGYCVQKQAECGAKCVPKLTWNEQVGLYGCTILYLGVLCLANDKFSVLEYSEIPEHLAKSKNADGSTLSFNAANIANHFYSLDFLKRIESFEDELEYHIARKKIKHIDLETGTLVSPVDNNGIKLELFIFDVLPFTKSMAVLEVRREHEFSPLKNKEGADSPATSRADILKLHASFIHGAGGTCVGDGEIEISPLISYEGEGLDAVKGKTIQCPILINFDSDLKKV